MINDYVLRTTSLTKLFRGYPALEDVSITLRAGKIYGLIGQNGAGKTSLMRIITGLSFPSSGTMELFGHSGITELQEERKRIGALIEYPCMNPNMSAKENMKLHRIIKGIPDTSLDKELLEIVGLSDTGKKKVKDFSLGMRQRLGIAVALLGNPELLLLDEPVNGLDPLGVVEIRNLIKRMSAEKNITILISSHNLPELYQTATDYIIIDKGRIKKCINQEELEDNCQRHIRIQCTEPERLLSVLEMHLHTTKYRVMPDKSVKLYDMLEQIESLAVTLFKNGIIMTRFSIEGDTLENYFISIIGGERND